MRLEAERVQREEHGMLCERCGEVTETFVTERYGELCEACQRAVEQEREQSLPPRRPPAHEDS